MLELSHIVKNYDLGDTRVEALRDVSIVFRPHEFVCVLGPSGCGKTTLLNIIGGLDHYTSGDLSVNGRSTASFKEADWDAYRNHSIGFVFQSYNLIPHQSVLENVELALTLSGVSRGERRRRAVEALTKVGLADQLKKKPNQMSGGQMQRVAIARALVNDPEILLADEPTGALDSETSVQIMEILKEISKDRLIIMVTHNPDLAQTYSSRIVRLLDGRVVGDSNPYDPGAQTPPAPSFRQKKPSMSLLTALSLSFKNLLTKKTRTVLTAFAGSIGIIGIALILSVSSGVQAYIDAVQRDTLSSYPITLQAETVDMSSLITSFAGVRESAGEATHPLDAVYASPVMYDLANAMTSLTTQQNNLAAFRAFLAERAGSTPFISSVQYTYELDRSLYVRDKNGDIVKSDAQSLMMEIMSSLYHMDTSLFASPYVSSMGGSSARRDTLWQEMLPGTDGSLVSPMLREQYDLVYGAWPTDKSQVVLILNENNELSDLVLCSLGLMTREQIADNMRAMSELTQFDTSLLGSWTYEDICGIEFRLFLPGECYQQQPDGSWADMRDSEEGLQYLFASAGLPVRISGIVRPNDDAVATSLSGAIGYTSALTDYLIDEAKRTPLLSRQLSEPTVDVFTALPFDTGEAVIPSPAEMAQRVDAYIASLSAADKAALYTSLTAQPSEEALASLAEEFLAGHTREELTGMLAQGMTQRAPLTEEQAQGYIQSMDEETLDGYLQQMAQAAAAEAYEQKVSAELSALSTDELAARMDGLELTPGQYAELYEQHLPSLYSDATYAGNLRKLGYVDESSPATINLYAATFADKDRITALIREYNDSADEADRIEYTDYVALLMSSITTIINAISYVLIAFVAISLVVSSIMIGIITYISVLERTKEIGILRAIGASRRDVARVFNAETLIVGFVAGAMGIGITLLLNQLINLILHRLTGIATLSAVLPWQGAVILVVISMLLTFIAGLIPSGLAARKDPVVALRTE